MKIRITRPVLVYMEKTHLDEMWDRNLKKWEELQVEKILPIGKDANIYTYDGDVLYHVPLDAFENLT